MRNSNFKKIDILRNRREENFLLEPTFIDNKKYVKKGIYIGSFLISLSLISGIFFMLRSNFLENKKSLIKSYSDEYDSLQIKLNNDSVKLKLIAGFNRDIKKSILNISSSSALLTEISFRIPKKMQLTNLIAEGNTLTLESKTKNKMPLTTINGFMLNLDDSEFIEFSDIDLMEISHEGNEDNSFFTSIIKTKITNDFENINQKYLEKLGSYGLAERINRLKTIDENI